MSSIILIVEPDPYVAEDLSEIVHETVTGAQVIHAPKIDEHTISIVDEMAVSGVFLCGSIADEATRDLVARLSQRGVALARIGRTGDREITSGGPETYVHAPFTGEAIATVLRGWTGRGDTHTGPDAP